MTKLIEPTYSWKQCYGSVTVDLSEEPKGKGSISELLGHRIIDAHKKIAGDIWHGFNWEFRGNNDFGYRRYRKGKNRCWICGLKLGTPEHKDFESGRTA